jgi:D-xylulose reductase
MRALVLERKRALSLRDIDLPTRLGPDDVRIKLHSVGVCGSDVHYYTHGGIGSYIVKSPMVLGHEASGTVTEIGANVRSLAASDRVCMEPGIPNFRSKATRLGVYNVDPEVTLLGDAADPRLSHRLGGPSRSLHLQASRQRHVPGGRDGRTLRCGHASGVAGAHQTGRRRGRARYRHYRHHGRSRGASGGCSKILLSDVHQPKLDIASRYPGIIPVNITKRDLLDEVMDETGGWGGDVVFDASGAAKEIESAVGLACPACAIVLVGIPVEPVAFSVRGAIGMELLIETVFRYANMYERALNLIDSGKVDLKPLISSTFDFERSIEAFERAAEGRPADVKLQIGLTKATA